jgi:TfoX/Sxy family transcriptional regulator of competence genes
MYTILAQMCRNFEGKNTMDSAERKRRIAEFDHILHAALASARPGTSLMNKSMFGGAGWYADGVFFAAWFGESLALKLPEAQRQVLIAQGWGTNWSREYIEVPTPILDEPALLGEYLLDAIAYASAPKRPKTRSKLQR